MFLHGPSGCGKSTLLNLISGVLDCQQGDIKLLGTSLSHSKASTRDRIRGDHIGFIFQVFNLLPYLSVLDNVVLPCRFSSVRKQRAEADFGSLKNAALEMLGHLGLNGSHLDKPVTELSVGQQQRVAAARALMGSPELIIADEPTSALDADTRQAFIELLMGQVKQTGSGLLFVSHDHSLSQLFDHSVSLPELNAIEGVV